MDSRSFLFRTAAGLGLSLLLAGGVSAATLNFDGVGASIHTPLVNQGFQLDVARIVNGNCGASNPCLALNDNETTTVTRVGGGTFSLTSLWFQLLGRGTNNSLTLTAAGPAGMLVLDQPTYDHNTGHTIAGALLALFQNVTAITFSTAANGGNVRIDDLGLVPTVPSSVPLPAAAGFMLLALGGLGVAGRRRKV